MAKTNLLLIGGDIELLPSDVYMNDVTEADGVLMSSLDFNKRLVFFDKFPKEKTIVNSRFPIVIYFNTLDRYKIPQYIKRSFTIKYGVPETNIFKVLSTIFYNPDRDGVYEVLNETKVPPILLYKWIECNAHRVWTQLTAVCVLDTLLHKVSSQTIYKYIAYSLPVAQRRIQFRWIK